MTQDSIARKQPGHAASRVTEAIRDFVSNIPPSHESWQAEPEQRARAVASGAARTAALTAGSLAIPPGPLGWLTILPEIVAVWKIQSQMISDLAGVYGVEASLTQEQMMYCLFRHSAAQAVRDLAVRVGERVLVRKASLRVTQRVVEKVGLHVTQRSLSRGISRFLPVVGAVGVGAYAYYDTTKVAETAMELFASELPGVAVPQAQD
jgi:hypothetical protein